MDKIKVNDGRGLFDSEGICDKGVSLLNSAVKDLVTGQYIAFCDKVTQVTRIFANLKTGIKADRESLQEKIEDLKRINDSIMEEKTGLPVLKECSDDGNGKV